MDQFLIGLPIRSIILQKNSSLKENSLLTLKSYPMFNLLYPKCSIEMPLIFQLMELKWLLIPDLHKNQDLLMDWEKSQVDSSLPMLVILI